MREAERVWLHCVDTPRAVFTLAVDIVAFLAALRLASLALLSRDAPGTGATRMAWSGRAWSGRALTTVGSIALGTTAVLAGTGIEDEHDTGFLLILRFMAGALLFAGALFVSSGVSRWLLLLAGTALVLADLAMVDGNELLGVVFVGVAAVFCSSAAILGLQNSLVLRVASAGTAVLVAVVLVLAGLLPGIVARSLRDEEVRRIAKAAGVDRAMIDRSVASIPQQVVAMAGSLGKSESLSIALAFGDRGRVQADLAEARAGRPGVDAVALFGPSGEVLAADGAQPDQIAGVAKKYLDAGFKGEPYVELESWSDSSFVVLTGAPFTAASLIPGFFEQRNTEPFYFGLSGNNPGVPVSPGALVASPTGVLIGLDRIDQSALTEYQGGGVDEDFTAFHNSGAVISTHPRPPRSLAGFLQGREGADLARAVLSEGKTEARRGRFRDSTLFVGAAPIRLQDGTIVGAFAVSTKGHLENKVRDSLLPALFVVLVTPAGLGFFVAVFLGLRMEKPVRRLTRAARRMSEGDLSVRGEVGSSAGRVGELGASVEAMAGSMVRMSAELDEIALWRTQFLASLAHALRTPLTPIRGYAEMLRSRQLGVDQERNSIEGIMDASEELERTIDMLVDFAALDDGRFTLRMSDVAIAPMLVNLVERWSGRYSDRAIRVEMGDGMPVMAMDAKLVERSLDELIDNALRHSPVGSTVVVRAELVELPSSGETSGGVSEVLEISFGDDGMGIPPAVYSAIEADRPLDSVAGTAGTFGLGLPFVQSVARAHGGRLVAERRSSGGSLIGLQLSVPPS